MVESLQRTYTYLPRPRVLELMSSRIALAVSNWPNELHLADLRLSQLPYTEYASLFREATSNRTRELRHWSQEAMSEVGSSFLCAADMRPAE